MVSSSTTTWLLRCVTCCSRLSVRALYFFSFSFIICREGGAESHGEKSSCKQGLGQASGEHKCAGQAAFATQTLSTLRLRTPCPPP